MSEEFVTYVCPMCGGPSHPATGCVYSPTFVVCWRCTEEAWTWIRVHTNTKIGRINRNNKRKILFFYDHVK